MGKAIWAAGLACAAAIGLFTVGASAFGQQAEPGAKTHHMEHDAMFQACAKACSDCQRACDMCATHCSHLLAEGKKDHLKTLASCQDCATTCAAASQVAARGGPFAAILCTACGDICAKCGSQCESFPDDAHMKACAAECRKCEKACAAMAAHSH